MDSSELRRRELLMVAGGYGLLAGCTDGFRSKPGYGAAYGRSYGE